MTTTQADPMRWIWRGIAALTLIAGWAFILVHNKFNVTTPVVVIMLGYFAAVATLMNLWRVGAAAVAPEDAGRDAWARPLGAKGQLEKEKKTLLKAIKEAEFDHAMGKLSKADVDMLIREYRGRAIEVIKELDRLEAGEVGTARERIKREVAARVAIEKEEAVAKAVGAGAAGKGKGKGKGKDATSTDAAPDVKADAKTEATADASSDAKADAPDDAAIPSESKAEESTEATS